MLHPRRFFLGIWNMKGFLSEERPIRTLREVLQRLRESYCGSIGYEVWPVSVIGIQMFTVLLHHSIERLW